MLHDGIYFVQSVCVLVDLKVTLGLLLNVLVFSLFEIEMLC